MTMTNQNQNEDVFNFPGNGALFDSILSRRAMAFLIDIVLIGALIFVAGAVVFILGILTFGLLWILMPFIMPPVIFMIVIAYVAFTTGGDHAATPGMRALGLQLRMLDGRKVYRLMAVFHALAFYFFITVLTPFVILIGFFTQRQRLLHDYIAGAIVINRDALPDQFRDR